jgi:hypothetical protein
MAVSGQYSAKIPTTSVWDPSTIPQNIDPILKELFIRMYQNLNLMANVLNVADIGFYTNQFEFVNGQQYFANPANNSATQTNATQRPVFRTTINFGTLPNNGVPIAVNHNIQVNGAFSFTRIYGCATDPGTRFIPLPYVSAADVAHNIELNVTNTQVIITSGGADYSAFTTAYVVLEYIKF